MERKIIIDTDPGVDDALAIFLALSCPEIEVMGLTTIFGNVTTETASQNALRISEMLGCSDIPVAQGALKPLKGEFTGRAYFVHGENGLGDVALPEPKGKIRDQTAAQFIVDTVLKNPHEVTLVVLGPQTNLALALELNPKIAGLVKEVVIMGGVINENGNVNPVAEANIIADPEAADKVLTAPWPVVLIGLDVTRKIIMTDEYLGKIKNVKNKFGEFFYQASRFYLNFYQTYMKMNGICGHDPSTIVYLLRPDLFEVKKGAVRVMTEGLARGLTVMDQRQAWYGKNAWSDLPKVQVALGVDAKGVLNVILSRLQ